MQCVIKLGNFVLWMLTMLKVYTDEKMDKFTWKKILLALSNAKTLTPPQEVFEPQSIEKCILGMHCHRHALS